jgi:fructokinase
MRLGIDLGGTKTEIIALDDAGAELYRKRVPTDRHSYQTILDMLVMLVEEAESSLGTQGTVGIGIPGTVSAHTGLIKNANTTRLIGHALDRDLGRRLNREIRCMNDANCLALSEAVDGAGAGHHVVFAAILGTGCGSGIALGGAAWSGVNLVAGEWGHNPLPWMTEDEFPGIPCWCGRQGCIERYISGTGFADDYERTTGDRLRSEQIIAAMRKGDAMASAVFERYVNRLTRSLAHVINLLDPDVIVLGGGMSNVDELYARVPAGLSRYVFGGEATTPVVQSKQGDSSGVRGAAWLWPGR